VPPRTYRVDEANLVLPEVRRLTGRIAELNGQLPELQDEQRIAEYLARRPGAGAQDRRRNEDATARLQSAEDEMMAAVSGLDQLGVQLKDASSGLVDFLSYREGELIELCWKLGEERIAHWHRIGEGYPGRKPL
jgi:hypothetical protein